MKNQEIAAVFYEIADILEAQDVQWKPQAYRKAAKAIRYLKEDIKNICKKGKLKDIPGVGENISKKIEEMIKTGKLSYYEKLKKQAPKFTELTHVLGLGPKRANLLRQKLGITSIKQLEKAAKEHKIAKLKTFGVKSEEDILRGIILLKKGRGRIPLKQALPIAKKLEAKLKKLKEVSQIEIAGSIRRKKETIRDIDILVSSPKPKKIVDYFTSLPEVANVLAKGPTKSSIILKNRMQVDLRVVPDDCFGSALQYLTGSKEHSIKLRQYAMKKGLKISEYGVFDKKTNRKIAGKTEKGVYAALGLRCIEPELRINGKEIKNG